MIETLVLEHTVLDSPDNFEEFLAINENTSFFVSNPYICPLAYYLRGKFPDVPVTVGPQSYAIGERGYVLPEWATNFVSILDQQLPKNMFGSITGKQAILALRTAKSILNNKMPKAQECPECHVLAYYCDNDACWCLNCGYTTTKHV